MKNSKLNITFACFTFKQPFITATIRRCVEAVLSAEQITAACEINILVTDDRGIQAINAATRNLDKPTDVLSFPMFTLIPGQPPQDWSGYMDPETGMCPLGDMAISLERAAEQSKTFGHSLRREVGYLTIHSILHLLGYDHLDEGSDKEKMRAREEYIANLVPGVQRKRRKQ